MTDTIEASDELAILEALAGQSEPRDMFALIRTINPRPAPRPGRKYVDFRTREAKAWSDRDLELMVAFIGLCNRGVITQARDGDGVNPAAFTLTEEAAR